MATALPLADAVKQESSSTSAESKLGLCEVCAIKDAKYTCPRCEVKTCSLACNRIHKKEVECNGERDRTKFIALNKFSNMDLSSDYRLLEEITRAVEVAKNARFKAPRFDKRLIKLQQQALEKHVTLQFLPSTFERHKNNTTRFNPQQKVLNWHIDWIFVNSDNWKVSEDLVPETLRFGSIISKYLAKQEDPELQEKLQYYQAADLPGIKLLLKAEKKPGRKFYEIDTTYTLEECLRGKIIVEYPIIHVVLRDQASFYDIIDSDDEDDDKTELQNRIKSGQEVINKIISRSESNESLYASLKNLLFVSEYSDDE